jgi:hypothetical protein
MKPYLTGVAMQIGDEATFCVFWAAVACYLYYLLLSGKASGGPMQYNLSRMLDLKRKSGIPHWPVIEATVTKATRTTYDVMSYDRITPDKIDVAFEYEIAGIRHENCFVVLYPPVEGYWAALAANVAVGERVTIRYDPENPSDSIPAEKTWHGWPVWTMA